MSVIDKFLDVMRLNDDDDYEMDNDQDLDEDDDDYDEEEKPRTAFSKKEIKPEVKRELKEPVKEKSVPTSSKITPITKSQRKQVHMADNTEMAVRVFQPTKMEDEVEIVNTLLRGKTVVINVEGLNVEIAQRIIDFTSGSSYAIQGNLQKISNYIFLATPNGVEISGDIHNILDTLDDDLGGFNF